ncbi:hypothetical protein T07_1282, partial [Trichinella nelsoni]
LLCSCFYPDQSTIIYPDHPVSQQFRFLVFFIVTV